MKKTKSQTLNINQTTVVWALVAFIVLSIGLYIYFVNVTILQTADRQHIEEIITDTKSQISQLELEFIENNRGVTKEYAESLGFKEASSVVFLTRSDTRLTFNEPQP